MLLSQVWEGANKHSFDDETLPIKITRGVSHCGLAIYVKKSILIRPKKELWKFKYFTMQKYNRTKKFSKKRNKKSFKIS
jgi:hypothetical protein